MSKCTEERCSRQVHCRGLCEAHYRLKLRHGDIQRSEYRTGLPSQNPVEYNAYRKMIYRCYNERAPHYKNWGGRGIKVCSRWASWTEQQSNKRSNNKIVGIYKYKYGYRASIVIRGKQYTKTLKSLDEAISWRSFYEQQA